MRGYGRASRHGSPELEGAEVAVVLEEAAVARRCWNMLGDVWGCFLVCEEGECGVGRARGVTARVRVTRRSWGRRQREGCSGGLLEFMSASGDV